MTQGLRVLWSREDFLQLSLNTEAVDGSMEISKYIKFKNKIKSKNAALKMMDWQDGSRVKELATKADNLSSVSGTT